MSKIHVVLKKEEVSKEKVEGKIAIVFDVLLATSTITASIHYGANCVIPVIDQEEAKKVAKERGNDDDVLVGEYEGRAIDGFLVPNPVMIRDQVKGKNVILSTTNGTVAIHKASGADHVYISSLLNCKSIAEVVNERHQDETIVIICSGSSNEFCLEDFYGAGCIIEHLLAEEESNWELTDSAKAAKLFFSAYKEQGKSVLKDSYVGQMLIHFDCEEEIDFVASRDILPIVAVYDQKNKRVVKEE